jgi:hypothetical protein
MSIKKTSEKKRLLIGISTIVAVILSLTLLPFVIVFVLHGTNYADEVNMTTITIIFVTFLALLPAYRYGLRWIFKRLVQKR